MNDKFSNNIVDSKKQFEYIITDFEIIKDLPKDVLEVTRNAYKSKFLHSLPIVNYYSFGALTEEMIT